LARAANQSKRLGERIKMHEDRAAAIPNLEAVKWALRLEDRKGSRDRVSVREAGWQHLDAGKVSRLNGHPL
jgi:hypothetical protein